MYENRYYWEIEKSVANGEILWVVDKKDKQRYCINCCKYELVVQLICRIEKEPDRYVIWSDGRPSEEDE